MNLLTSLKASVALFAVQAIAAAMEDGKELGGELLADAKELGGQILVAAQAEADKVEGQVEDTFLKLTQQFGALASQFVTTLLPTTVMDGVTLDGAAKANLATTQLVDAAAQQGITLAGTHASSIIQNAYMGAKDVVSQLFAKAEAAVQEQPAADAPQDAPPAS